jgi:hypothetical protein
MRRGLQTLALVLLCAVLAAACDNGEEQAARPQTTQPTGVELPAAVADKREAVVAAAHALDYNRLETLLDPATFSYSFGESGDPIGYWRRLEQEGHVPILGDYLPVILGGPFARRGDIYVWPSVYGKKSARWTSDERRWLRNFYSEEEIRNFEQIGDYLGWRVGIRKDGTWLFFVAGD